MVIATNVPGGSVCKQPIEQHCVPVTTSKTEPHKKCVFLALPRVYLQKASLKTAILLMYTGENKRAKSIYFLVTGVISYIKGFLLSN